jgi:RNA polymerase sigma-70 factor (ECF subfamily)
VSSATLSFPWVQAAPLDQASEADWDARAVQAAIDDPAAFRFLVERYQGRVYATALRMVGDAADAQDIAQESLLRAYRALDRFEQGRRFAPWVCVIAANAARDHLRSPRRRLQALGLWPTADRAADDRQDPIEREQERDALAHALLTLKPRLREAMVLRYVSDLSVEEVAEALGIGLSAAKMRLSRGTEQLRALLGDDAI